MSGMSKKGFSAVVAVGLAGNVFGLHADDAKQNGTPLPGPPLPEDEKLLTIVVQNIQKKSGLASRVVDQYKPDIFLVQEVDEKSEPKNFFGDATFTSRIGYGTAVYSTTPATNVRKVKSPVAETGGFIKKKTVVCNCGDIQCVTFHGYNGTPTRDVAGLLSHVQEVIKVLEPNRPSIFAGDFNSWTEIHLAAVRNELHYSGFNLALSWKYPPKDKETLDHVFLRGMEIVSSEIYMNEADHRGAVLKCKLLEGFWSPQTDGRTIDDICETRTGNGTFVGGKSNCTIS